MGFPLYGLLDAQTRSRLNQMRTGLKQQARARWEQERDRVLADKKAAELTRKIEKARSEGWMIAQAIKTKPSSRTIKGACFTRVDLAILAAEMIAPRKIQA